MMKKVLQICAVGLLGTNTAFSQTWETLLNDSLVSRSIYKKGKLVDSSTAEQHFHFSYHKNGKVKEKTVINHNTDSETIWHYEKNGALASKVQLLDKKVVYSKQVEKQDARNYVVSINSWNCHVRDSLPRLYWRSERENSWPLEAYQNTYTSHVLSQKVHYLFSQDIIGDSMIALGGMYSGGELFLPIDSLKGLVIPVLPKNFLKETRTTYNLNMTNYLEENAAKILVTSSFKKYYTSVISAVETNSKPLHELQRDFYLRCHRDPVDSSYYYVFRSDSRVPSLLVISPSVIYTSSISTIKKLPKEIEPNDVRDATVTRYFYEPLSDDIVLEHEFIKHVCKKHWVAGQKSYAFSETRKESFIDEHISPYSDQIPYYIKHKSVSVDHHFSSWDIKKSYSVKANYPFCDSSLISFSATNKDSGSVVFFSYSSFSGTITQKNGNTSRVVYFNGQYQLPTQLLSVVTGKQSRGSLDTVAIVSTKVEKHDNQTIREISGTLLAREFKRFESERAKLLIEKIKYQKGYSTFKIIENLDSKGRLKSSVKYIDNTIIEQKTVVKK